MCVRAGQGRFASACPELPLASVPLWSLAVRLAAARSAGGRQGKESVTESPPASCVPRAPERNLGPRGRDVGRARLRLPLAAELPEEVSGDSAAPSKPEHQRVTDRHDYALMECWFLTGTGNSAKYYSFSPSPCLKGEDKRGRGVLFARARFPAALCGGSSSHQTHLGYFSLLDVTGP